MIDRYYLRRAEFIIRGEGYTVRRDAKADRWIVRQPGDKFTFTGQQLLDFAGIEVPA